MSQLLQKQFPMITPQWKIPVQVSAAITLAQGDINTNSWLQNCKYGEYNLANHIEDDALAVNRRRQNLLTSLPHGQDIQWLQQRHTDQCLTVHSSDQTNQEPLADASYTQIPGIVCSVLTADCVPILLCDIEGREVAAVHAGWRGLAQHIIANTLKNFANTPKQLLAYIGPCISQAYYSVGHEVYTDLLQSLNFKPSKPQKTPLQDLFQQTKAGINIDLAGVARQQLQQLGLETENITLSGLCTFADHRFNSYRRSSITGRFASCIWLTNRI